jgi:hypothetical protein
VRFVEQRCPFVLLGTWNMAIFTPAFVRSIAPGEGAVEQMIRPITGGLVFEFPLPDFILTVQHERVALVPKSVSEDSLRSVAATAQMLLEALPRTPVSAAGINFGFDEECDATPRLREVFILADEDQFAGAGVSLERRILRNQFVRDPQECMLTVVLTKDFARKSIALDVNYQRHVQVARAVADMPNAIIERKAKSIAFLQTVYGVTLEGS